MSFDLDGYVDVAERIGIFRAKYPEGSLQPVDLSRPFTIETIGNKVFVVYVAAAYRTPDDERPGVGVAWEPFPGPTQFTHDSELMNAETAAWGRAIVATLAADTKKVASSQEVRNRRPDSANTAPAETGGPGRASSSRLASSKQRFALERLIEVHGPPEGCSWPLDDNLSMRQASTFLDALKAPPDPPPNERVGTLRTDVAAGECPPPAASNPAGESGEPDHPGSDAAESLLSPDSPPDTFVDTYDLADYSPDPF